MQPLTSASPAGTYTSAELLAALSSGFLAISPRFELLDAQLGRVGDLTTITKGTVEMNVDRAVKGALSITMLPDPLLPFETAPFSCYIKPWFRILMPDGGYAEWPQGVFIWNRPKRTVIGSGDSVEEWTMTLGDRGHVLLAGGPGPTGYTIAGAVKQTDAVIQTLQSIFGNSIDISRIVASSSTVASTLVWDMTQNDASGSGTSGTTWSDILQALADSLGYYSLWFDGNGTPVSEPVPSLATAPADVTYSSGAQSILQAPLVVDEQLDSLANRVIVRAHGAAPTAPFIVATADLNTLIPGHPYSQAVIGFYIDAVIDDSVAGTPLDLQARADSELYSRASMFQSVEIATQAWPVHEAFDIVGVQWVGDSDFDSPKNLHERGWTLDLFTGDTKHLLRRIVP